MIPNSKFRTSLSLHIYLIYANEIFTAFIKSRVFIIHRFQKFGFGESLPCSSVISSNLPLNNGAVFNRPRCPSMWPYAYYCLNYSNSRINSLINMYVFDTSFRRGWGLTVLFLTVYLEGLMVGLGLSLLTEMRGAIADFLTWKYKLLCMIICLFQIVTTLLCLN